MAVLGKVGFIEAYLPIVQEPVCEEERVHMPSLIDQDLSCLLLPFVAALRAAGCIN